MSTKVYLSKLFVEAIFRDIFEKLLYRDVLRRKLPPHVGGSFWTFKTFVKQIPKFFKTTFYRRNFRYEGEIAFGTFGRYLWKNFCENFCGKSFALLISRAEIASIIPPLHKSLYRGTEV
jgi:hypothetical protein